MSILSYQFSSLTSHIDTNSFIVPTPTENVSVVLVQDHQGCLLNCHCDLVYSLMAGDSIAYGPIEVNGEYKSQSDTITFYNVSPGTYKMQIGNLLSRYPAEGNGHIYY